MKDAVIYYRYSEKTIDRKLSQELRALAADRYFDSLGIEDRPVFSEEVSGKPCFSDGRFHFSVSHSGRLYAILFYPERCGFDIELVPGEKKSFDAIAKRFFSENEREIFFGAGGPTELFYRLWTAKEAAVKLSGAGLSGISSTDVTKDKYFALPDGLFPVRTAGAIAAENLPESIRAIEF